MAKDQYGIPQPGGNNGPYAAHKWKGINYVIPWKELMATIALAGWPEKLWGMAGAVCAAESGRNPFIYNTYKQGHFGLFQISRAAWPEFFDKSGNKGMGEMGWVSPVLNATKGYEIYRKQGWGAWEGKTDGGYLAFYSQAMLAAADLQRTTGVHGGDEKGYWTSLLSNKTFDLQLKALDVTAADIAAAANASVGGAVAGAAGATADATVSAGSEVAAAVNSQFGWLPDMWTTLTTPALWMRMGYGTLGVVLAAGGLFMILRNRPAVQKTAAAVTSAAGKVMPAAGAAKAAAGKAAGKAAPAGKPAAPKPAAPKPAPKPAAPKGGKP